MNGGPLRRTIVVVNPQGFHMRPAAAVAEAARRFQSRLTVSYGQKSCDPRRVLDLLMLAAERGAELVLEADGPDAAEALRVVGDLMAAEEPPPEGGKSP